MESYHFAHFVGTATDAANVDAVSTAHVALVHEVRSAAADILQDVKAGGGRAFEGMPMALVDARMIASKQHILTAIHQAMLRYARQQKNAASGSSTATATAAMRTKTIHSEVLWMLSPTNNIADSFRTFGLSESTNDLLLIHLAPAHEHGGPSADEVASRIRTIMNKAGETDERGLDALDVWQHKEAQTTSMADWAAITKSYKLGDVRAAVSGDDDVALTADETERARRERIDALATSIVAMKSVAS